MEHIETDCPDCPDCRTEMKPFINAIPSTGDDVGFRCDECGESWTMNEWEERD